MSTEENMVTIPRKFYFELLERDAWLSCLEAAGVDNWDGYYEAGEIEKERRRADAERDKRGMD